MKNLYFTLLALFCIQISASAQVPKLNSFPSASAVVFLDFDGHKVEGTSWNYDGPIDCSSANLNSTQLTEVFNRLAEDYRPFNLNVTTDSTVYWAAPPKQRTRVVLTTSSSWYGSAGGVSYTNSFTWGDNTPCFVFTALLNYNVKFISEAASHEVGHTLGLNHQSSYDPVCNKTAEYNPGSGSGEIAWAPIMGVGYYRNMTLWHYGSNPYGCSYMQDDLSIITSDTNGFGFRTDDHGNTKTKATAAVLTNNQFIVNGVIETPGDADMVKFTLKADSRFKLNALPYNVSAGFNGANVDLQVELANGTLTTTNVYNPPSMLQVSIDTLLPAGTYYLRVLSKGNSFAPDFASLGSYTMIGSTESKTLPLHKLELKGLNENNHHQLNWEIVADEQVVEQVLEVATDGINFQRLASLQANERNFGYQPAKTSLLHYRLGVTFDNGRKHYSNIAAVRSNGASGKPYLLGNVVSSDLIINSPSIYRYTVFDLNGRSLAKGQLAQGVNRVSIPFMTNGVYILHYSNNQEQYTEKFMKK